MRARVAQRHVKKILRTSKDIFNASTARRCGGCYGRLALCRGRSDDGKAMQGAREIALFPFWETAGGLSRAQNHGEAHRTRTAWNAVSESLSSLMSTHAMWRVTGPPWGKRASDRARGTLPPRMGRGPQALAREGLRRGKGKRARKKAE